MATMQTSRSLCSPFTHSARPTVPMASRLPTRATRGSITVAQAGSKTAEVTKALSLATAVATFAAAGNANAAQEIAQLAAGDNRLGLIATLFLPVIGWVGFNIGGPALNQLSGMGGSAKAKRAIAVGLGLASASMVAVESADAATEIAQLAAGDNRPALLATLFLPVIGWVLFNIGGPALNQLSQQAAKNGGALKAKRRVAVAGLVGLSAASLLAAPQADAATEIAQIAAGDNRFGIIAILFLPVIGWVLFNIGGPALNQLSNQAEKNKASLGKPKFGKKR